MLDLPWLFVFPIGLEPGGPTATGAVAASQTSPVLGTDMEAQPDGAVLGALRRKIAAQLESHEYESAVFLADKLVSMSNGAEDDVYTLAQAYFRAGMHQRAIYAIVQAGLVERHKFRFLVAKCHVAKENWEEALQVLGESPAEAGGGEVGDEDYSSSMSLLRGTVYDAMDDRERAIAAYRTALHQDCCCYEAFKHLTEHHLLTSDEEQALLSELDFGEENAWLELLYKARIDRYQASRAQAPPPSPADAADGAPMMTEESASASSTGGQSLAMPHLNALENTHNLKGNLDLMSHRAEVQYYSHDFRAAVATCRDILQRDPYHLTCLPVYLCTLHELQQKNELFYQAHKLVDEHPQAAVSWFAVGCYYHLTGNYDSARRYFEKSTHIDNWFAPAWLGYGNAFAAQDESDQALVAYRTAAKLFPGCHLCTLFVGMECARTNNIQLASRYFDQAVAICPNDPHVYNEIGVIHYKNQEYALAREYFLRVLSLCGDRLLHTWETTLFNLGHTCRKLRLYNEAIDFYMKAQNAQPQNASVYAALGFTYHLKGGPGSLHTAIDYYHQALGLKSEDTFATEMLRKAFEEIAGEPF